MSTMTGQVMTVDLMKVALPKNLQGNATQAFCDLINQLALDPETCDEVRSNFLTYSKVLQDGKFKTEDYLNAVIYATHKFMGYSNKDAYRLSFPGRYQAMVARGYDDKKISSYVSAYSKNQMVNQILEQALIPAHILYQDAFHQAIKTQLELMVGASSEKVRADAANSILTHLKAPEVKKVELSMDVKSSGGIEDLRQTMEQLARQQREIIAAGGATAGQMARAPIMLTQAEKDQAIDVFTGSAPMTPTELDEPAEPWLDPVYQGPPENTAAPGDPAEPDAFDPDPEWLATPGAAAPVPPRGESLFGFQVEAPKRSIFDPPPAATPDTSGAATTPAKPSLFGAD